MSRVLLDTDIFSEVLKSIDPRVAGRGRVYLAEYGRYTISAITVMEIVKGLHRSGRQDRAEQVRSRLGTTEVLIFDAAAADLAGRILADLERTGQPIGRADPMIAAIALRERLPLVTGNVSHFARIQALGYPLELENWRM